MNKWIICSILALTAAFASAETGVGATVSTTSFGGKHSVYPETYGSSSFSGTLTLALSLGQDWELDPYGQYSTSTQYDANGITGGDYIDGYKSSTYGVGANLFRVWRLGDQFRVLTGVGALVASGSLEYPGFTPTYGRLLLQATVPVAAEVLLTPTFGLRAQGSAAVAALDTTTYTTASGVSTNTLASFFLASSSLGLGVFLYF